MFSESSPRSKHRSILSACSIPRWNVSAKLAKYACAAATCGFLLLPWGTGAEHVRSKRIAAEVANAHVPERQPLDRMAALIAGASFVIGVDTGLIHLAAALSVPLVAIFTASEPGLTGPMGSGPIAVVGGKHKQPSVADVVGAFEQLT